MHPWEIYWANFFDLKSVVSVFAITEIMSTDRERHEKKTSLVQIRT